MNMYDVKAFFERYHKKVKINPNLYISGPHQIDVILPSKLINYANASSGHTGFGSGARARGIRREVKNSREALDYIFASVDNLVDFLNSSEQDAHEYIKNVRQKHLTQAPAGKSKREVSSKIDARSALLTVFNKGGYKMPPASAVTSIIGELNKLKLSDDNMLIHAEQALQKWRC